MKRQLLAYCSLLLFVSHTAFAPDPFSVQRARMVMKDIEGRGIKDKRLLEAMRKVPRHLFVGEGQRGRAYEDYPLPIGEGQTISQPYVVALMTEALKVKASDRVLEIGTGSGYQAAILAELAKEVFSVEIRGGLAAEASRTLNRLGYGNVNVRSGDGYFGWSEKAPFDAVIITASANHIPPPLIEQLKEGGALILPLGGTVFYQALTLVKKNRGGRITVEQMGPVAFVPMVGETMKK